MESKQPTIIRKPNTIDEFLAAYYNDQMDADSVFNLIRGNTFSPFIGNIQAFKNLRPPEQKEVEKRLAKSNPGLSWAVSRVKVFNEFLKVYYPRWSCWALFEDIELVALIQYEFLKNFEYMFKNAYICAASFPALSFLYDIEFELTKRGASIFPIDPRLQGTPLGGENSKLILFDINKNTGKTMEEAVKYFERIDWNPDNIIHIFNNDLVPPSNISIDESSKIDNRCLYKASSVIKFWRDQELVKVMLKVHEGLNNLSPQNSKETITAIKHQNKIHSDNLQLSTDSLLEIKNN